jgi:hypothetical protein
MMTPDRDSPCYGAISVAGNPKDNLKPEFMVPMTGVFTSRLCAWCGSVRAFAPVALGAAENRLEESCPKTGRKI